MVNWPHCLRFAASSFLKFEINSGDSIKKPVLCVLNHSKNYNLNRKLNRKQSASTILRKKVRPLLPIQILPVQVITSPWDTGYWILYIQ